MKLIKHVTMLGLFACAAFAIAAEEKKADLKCPVSGAPAKTEHAVNFNGGKVYFCCGNGQATQTKCPLSGGKVNAAQKVTVAGVEVQFCCMNCKGKVEKATGDEQAKLVFSDAAFKKGFEVKAAK